MLTLTLTLMITGGEIYESGKFFFALVFPTLKVIWYCNKLVSGPVAKNRTSVARVVQKLCPTVILMSNPNANPNPTLTLIMRLTLKVNIVSNRYNIEHFTTL